MLNLSPANWIELGVVLATLILAGATAWMARKTSKMAESAEKSAAATELSAKAAQESVAEIQQSRQADWLPYLSARISELSVREDRVFKALVVNLGRGPAIHCVCGQWTGEKVVLSTIFNVGPGARVSVLGTSSGVRNIVRLQRAFLVLGERPHLAKVITICRDGLVGRWYRFVQGVAAPTIWNLRDPLPEWVELIQNALPELKDWP
ncbi:MAG: hypothetical protein WBF51_06675 [Candidatus Dormiibacterota bacterium]